MDQVAYIHHLPSHHITSPHDHHTSPHSPEARLHRKCDRSGCEITINEGVPEVMLCAVVSQPRHRCVEHLAELRLTDCHQDVRVAVIPGEGGGGGGGGVRKERERRENGRIEVGEEREKERRYGGRMGVRDEKMSCINTLSHASTSTARNPTTTGHFLIRNPSTIHTHTHTCESY